MAVVKTKKEYIELLNTELKKSGIDPQFYSLIIDLTAETYVERDNAYHAFVENGGSQVNEKGGTNPYMASLRTWNNAVRACLAMLRLTPRSVPYPETEIE